MKAAQETCPHPIRKHTTPRFGHTVCSRCDADITDPGRSFEWQHGERTLLEQGDLVKVKRGEHGDPPYTGTFQWAEIGPLSDLYYVITELQRVKASDLPGGTGTNTVTVSTAVRFVKPERVRRYRTSDA